MNSRKSFEFSVLLLFFYVFMTTCAPTGVAIFSNPVTGVSGNITLRHNAILGTYLVGQIKNISCYNSSSATLNPMEASPVNNCMLGITINNWRENSYILKQYLWDRVWRQTIFNISAIKLPDIREILSGSYSPFPNLMQTTTPLPITANSSGMTMPQELGDTCANVGEVYNPNRSIFSGLLGFISPPGVVGNVMVNNGSGSILMGPLELMTAGPTSVMGLPVVIWMDSIRPVVNGTTVSLNRGSNDRILDCSIIKAN